MRSWFVACLSILIATIASAEGPSAIPDRNTPNDQSLADGQAIEEIVIEGERTDLTVQDSPHSVAVFTSVELRRGTDRTMDELLQHVANVTTSPGTGELIVRGVAENGITRGGFQGGFAGFIPNVVNFNDGFFTPSTQSLWDARQVEMSRGPENFASGGAMAALIAVSSSEDEDGSGTITGSWAPETSDRSIGIAYGSRISDKLGFRVAGFHRASDGFMDNVIRGGDDWNSYEESMVRARFDWQPADDDATEVMLRFERLKTNQRGDTYIVTTSPIDPFRYKTAVDTPTGNEEETLSAHGLLAHRFDDRWHMELRVSWTTLHQRIVEDAEGSEFELGYSKNHFDGNYPSAQFRVFYDADPWQLFFRQYGLRLDASNTGSRNFFPFDLDGDGEAPGSVVDIRYAYPTPNWWFIGTQVGAQRAFERLTVAASLARSGQMLNGTRRVTSTRVGSTGDPDIDAAYDFVYASFFPQAQITDDDTEFNWLPTLVVDFAFTDEVSIGAKYEGSARLGGLWFNPARGTVNRFKSEHADSFDVYLRSVSFDGRLALRANAFYTRFTDQQVYAALSEAPLDEEFVNAQRSHNGGLEIESSWSDGNWRVWSSMGLLTTRFDRIVVFDADYSGNNFPDAPDWTLAVGLLYQRARGLFVSADATLRPETQATIENFRGVVNEHQYIVNGRMGWRFHRVEVSIYGRNVFDEKYLTYHDKAIAVDAVPTYIVGAPREVGLTISLEI